MKFTPISIFAWGCRVIGWTFLGALLWCLSTNYGGMVLRGQVARTRFPLESQEALRWLEVRGGLEIREPCELTEVVWPANRSLFATIFPRPLLPLFVLNENGFPVWRLAMAFSADGELLGAPVPTRSVDDNVAARDYHEPRLLSLDSEKLLILKALTSELPPATPESTFWVYLLDFPRSSSVLTLHTSALPTSCRLRAVQTGTGTGIQLEWLSYMAHNRVVDPESGPVFMWDREIRQFLLPPADTHNRWGASFENPVEGEILRWVPRS